MELQPQRNTKQQHQKFTIHSFSFDDKLKINGNNRAGADLIFKRWSSLYFCCENGRIKKSYMGRKRHFLRQHLWLNETTLAKDRFYNVGTSRRLINRLQKVNFSLLFLFCFYYFGIKCHWEPDFSTRPKTKHVLRTFYRISTSWKPIPIKPRLKHADKTLLFRWKYRYKWRSNRLSIANLASHRHENHQKKL